MRDTNPMDSAVENQQKIFSPSPSLQVSRAQCSACAQVLVPFYGEEAAVLQWGEGVVSLESLIPQAASSSTAAGGAVCPWAGAAGWLLVGGGRWTMKPQLCHELSILPG